MHKGVDGMKEGKHGYQRMHCRFSGTDRIQKAEGNWEHVCLGDEPEQTHYGRKVQAMLREKWAGSECLFTEGDGKAGRNQM